MVTESKLPLLPLAPQHNKQMQEKSTEAFMQC